MGQPFRSDAEHLSALLQEQIDAWRDELEKTTLGQAKADRDTESNRRSESDCHAEASRKNTAVSGQQDAASKSDLSNDPPPEGPDCD